MSTEVHACFLHLSRLVPVHGTNLLAGRRWSKVLDDFPLAFEEPDDQEERSGCSVSLENWKSMRVVVLISVVESDCNPGSRVGGQPVANARKGDDLTILLEPSHV